MNYFYVNILASFFSFFFSRLVAYHWAKMKRWFIFGWILAFVALPPILPFIWPMHVHPKFSGWIWALISAIQGVVSILIGIYLADLIVDVFRSKKTSDEE